MDTSFGEVYFFGPKSILLLLKYWLNILLKLICPIEEKKAKGSLGGGQLVRVQPAVSQAAVQLYLLAVSLPVKHQQPGDKLGSQISETTARIKISNFQQ